MGNAQIEERVVPWSLSTAMKIYHLANCGTCQKILKDIPKIKRFEQQDIKTQAITPAQLDTMKKLAGSYEALFSRVAMKYRSMGLNEMTLTEKDYRKYILEEYTFLKRPTVIIGEQIFIGSAPKTVKAMLEAAGK
jgi:arsenate reductase